MSERGSHEPAQLSSAAHIDPLCDEFERACRGGRPPMIEAFLLRAPADEQDRLLAELLEIELDCRQRALTFMQVDEYRIRFPDHVDLVESLFRRVVKTLRLGDYELLEELGHGGMGVVYKARQVFLNQTVAVKILPHRYLDDAQAVARFRREMQSIGVLAHANIVRAYNAGEAGGVHFLVMEYVDGINLQRFVELGPPDGGPVGAGAACEILRQAALGLQHAHEHQLVHRDIKPANLMLARDGQIKILDMGLAKFHVESRGDRPQERLTQPGMTMGTIDYMAPEQWENSATADIRADIYSLGCTLFFLLTGRPPYGAPNYDTSRKKLMAHVVAPIPSLLENCADVPQELQDVYATMMAKEPSERFATPAEVAEAVAEFADAEELAEVIAALPPHEVCVAADNTNVNGRADTPRQEAGSHSRRRSHNRWTSRQRFRRNVTIGVTAGLTVVLCVLVATLMRPRDNQQAVSDPARSSGSAAAPSLTEPRPPSAADLALLPGLNGPWWFEETPWLAPFVRQAIADQLQASAVPASVLADRPRAYLSTNTSEAQQWLWQLATRRRDKLSPPQQKLFDQLKAWTDAGGNGGPAAPLQDALRQFSEVHKGQPRSAADLYTVALLQHAIASQDKLHRTAMAKEAKQSYDKALKAIAAQPKGQVSLQPLCLLDSALLCEHVLGDIKDAAQRLDEALAEKDLPVLLHISLLVERGRIAAAAATTPAEYEAHRFLYAKKLLEGSVAVKPTHPLAAFIAESYAASLLDQWRVEEAGKQFQAAYHIRLTNKEEKDPRAAIYVFADRRGTAVTNRFRGNLDAARRSCRTIVEEIQAALEEAQRGHGATARAGDMRALRSQLAESLVAWADCELYGGAVSGVKVNLATAAENYDRACKLALDESDSVALGSKLAIVRALAGKEKLAKELLAELDAAREESGGPLDQRAELTRQLAGAVLAERDPAKAEGRKLLRAFLDQFKLSPSARGPSRREIVEMQLLAAELLLTADLADDPRSARKDQKYLDGLLTVFQGRRDMRPYLRRYFELAVQACNKTDLLQIAHYLLDARMVARQDSPGGKSTLVLFSFTPTDNFAIFLPQDGRPGRRFELNLTRDDIKSSKGKPLHLNDDLVALIKGELAAERPVEIFWDDTASRPSEDPDALTDADWPFGPQLELAKVRPNRPAP